MSEECPLYPALTEGAEQEAVLRQNAFIDQIKKAMKEMLSEFYTNELPYIESATWSNFRNEIMDGFKNYNNRKIQGEYDFKEIRQAIYKEYREELIVDLNQDMVEEIASLKRQIKTIEDIRRWY